MPTTPPHQLTVSFDDFYGDVKKWSDEYLWPRCVRSCLSTLLGVYLLQLATDPEASAEA